ncbi:hypothetical protein [Streptomyces sp. WAC 01529]|uniref:hypothetical protein n=1 Tax=Streptomyces sp. WAC 01529 TaxID=2203205 RepID=UPI0013DE90DD|nr:hypothetical protein [Streptomyces sp. WAC 01529]
MSEGTRFCSHCDEPITKDHPGTSTLKHSISGAGALIWTHNECPRLPAFVRRYPT